MGARPEGEGPHIRGTPVYRCPWAVKNRDPLALCGAAGTGRTVRAHALTARRGGRGDFGFASDGAFYFLTFCT
jgi:hypothetical protein